MKNAKRIFAVAIILNCFLVSSASAQVKLVQQWLTEGLKTPESVLVYRDGRTKFLLVSQIDGDPSAVDGQGGIAKLSLSGGMSDENWVTGLNAPKGMAAVDGKLYVADITELVVIDIKKAQVERKIAVPGAIFLNDVTVDSLGDIYVSDTSAQKVHRLKKGMIEDYAVNLEHANGIKMIGGNLIVGAGTHLYLIDRNKNRLPVASGFAKNIDGIESINRGDFLVSCWDGLLYYVYLDGRINLLLDTQSSAINTADIAYDEETTMLYVPNFLKNSVTAYQVVAN